MEPLGKSFSTTKLTYTSPASVTLRFNPSSEVLLVLLNLSKPVNETSKGRSEDPHTRRLKPSKHTKSLSWEATQKHSTYPLQSTKVCRTNNPQR